MFSLISSLTFVLKDHSHDKDYCFYKHSQKGERIDISYAVHGVYNNEVCNVIFYSPTGEIVFEVIDSSYFSKEINTDFTGVYKMCFRTKHQDQLLIDFNINIDSEREIMSFAKDESVKDLKSEVEDVTKVLEHIHSNAKYILERRSNHMNSKIK